jgi:hypothetical protein
LDIDSLRLEMITADVLLAPDDVDAGEDGRVYFRKLGDPSVLSIVASSAEVVLIPPFELWSHLAWSRPHLVLVDNKAEELVVTAVQIDGDRTDAIYSTSEGIDSVWVDPEGVVLVVAHAPYPEVDLDAGSTITLIRGGERRDFALGRLNVAKTVSMTPDQSAIAFVESNTHRLGTVRVVDGSIEWIASDLDGAEISPRGRLATFRRTDDPASDEVCLQ